MPKSKTRLMHTRPTERPFYCITGDLSGEGFLVVVDESTHDVVVREGAEAGTLSVIVNPKGVEVKGVSTRPGTRMLDLDASSSDPPKQARESVTWRELPGTRAVEFPPSAERLQSGAIGAPRAQNQKVLSGDSN